MKKKKGVAFALCVIDWDTLGQIVPQKKILRKKKKALLAAWDDSNSSSSEEEQEEERANLCLMAHEDSEDEVSSNDFLDFTFEELLEVYHELIHILHSQLKNSMK